MRVKALNIKGVKICQMKNMKKIAKTMPYRSIVALKLAILSGSMEKSIFEPSKGGTGMRLKMANTILVSTTIANMVIVGAGSIST